MPTDLIIVFVWSIIHFILTLIVLGFVWKIKWRYSYSQLKTVFLMCCIMVISYLIQSIFSIKTMNVLDLMTWAIWMIVVVIKHFELKYRKFSNE